MPIPHPLAIDCAVSIRLPAVMAPGVTSSNYCKFNRSFVRSFVRFVQGHGHGIMGMGLWAWDYGYGIMGMAWTMIPNRIRINRINRRIESQTNKK